MQANKTNRFNVFRDTLPFVGQAQANRRLCQRQQLSLQVYTKEGQALSLLDISVGGLRVIGKTLLWPGNRTNLDFVDENGQLMQATVEVLSFVHTTAGIAMRMRFCEKDPTLHSYLAGRMGVQLRAFLHSLQ